jgi:hypothetical protein
MFGTTEIMQNILRHLVLIGVLVSWMSASADDINWRVERGVRQLFLDNVGIAQVENLKHTIHPPQPYPGNPVLRADIAWEDRCQVYGMALYDESARKFKCGA